MKIIYPIIQEPIRKNRKDKLGNTVNDARQYKKTYCKVFKITGKRYRKIQKIQRRILSHVNINT